MSIPPKLQIAQPWSKDSALKLLALKLGCEIPSEDIGRSTSDILHNVITRLNMSNYYSKRVTIFERPIRAEIIFRKINRLPAHMRTVSGRFQQKNQKRHDQFTLYVIINKGDAFGLNNILDYRFDVQELHAEEKHKVSKDIHQMTMALNNLNRFTKLIFCGVYFLLCHCRGVI